MFNKPKNRKTRPSPGVLLALLVLLATATWLFAMPASAEVQQQPIAEQAAQTNDPITIYFFWGEGCPHCAEAKPFLAGLTQRFPDVQVRDFEVYYVEGNRDLFFRMAAKFGFEPTGVPTIFIGDRYWEGYARDPIGKEIESYVGGCLLSGCRDAGLGVFSPTSTAAPTVVPAPVELQPAAAAGDDPQAAAPTPTVIPAVAPAAVGPQAAAPRSNGYTLALVIMAGMVLALVYTGMQVARSLRGAARPGTARLAWATWVTPILALIGLGVAGYLAYVETRQVAAICGPVGDCNAVQASPYARLFGVLPIGVLGVLGYVALLAAWLWGRYGRGRLAELAPLALFALALFGVLFSLYLTYLEPFVIRAVCAWCLTSAVIMTALLLLAVDPARRAWHKASARRVKELAAPQREKARIGSHPDL